MFFLGAGASGMNKTESFPYRNQHFPGEQSNRQGNIGEVGWGEELQRWVKQEGGCLGGTRAILGKVIWEGLSEVAPNGSSEAGAQPDSSTSQWESETSYLTSEQGFGNPGKQDNAFRLRGTAST